MALLIPTTKYKKDIKRLESRGADMALLDTVVDMIAAGNELPDHFRKHALSGNRIGQIDVHIKPDWLLLYEPITIDGEEAIIEPPRVSRKVYFSRHADAFDTFLWASIPEV